jgi:hypothetical protein
VQDSTQFVSPKHICYAASLLFVIVCSFCTLASVTMVKDQPQLEMGNISRFLNKHETFEQEQAFEVAAL